MKQHTPEEIVTILREAESTLRIRDRLLSAERHRRSDAVPLATEIWQSAGG